MGVEPAQLNGATGIIGRRLVEEEAVGPIERTRGARDTLDGGL